MKILKLVVVAATLGSLSFGASVVDSAKEISKKEFESIKKASVLKAQIKEICQDSFKAKMQVLKDLKDEDKKAFKQELKYQMRQNLATLGKDEVYDDDVCKKYMHKPMDKDGFKPFQPKADKK